MRQLPIWPPSTCYCEINAAARDAAIAAGLRTPPGDRRADGYMLRRPRRARRRI